MTRTGRILTLTMILLSLGLNSPAAIDPERDKNCPPDPDTGWIACGASCVYPSTCKPTPNAPAGTYCRQAKLANGYPAGVCFSGEYDPCCDPNYQW